VAASVLQKSWGLTYVGLGTWAGAAAFKYLGVELAAAMPLIVRAKSPKLNPSKIL
jgi:hypothetical protein